MLGTVEVTISMICLLCVQSQYPEEIVDSMRLLLSKEKMRFPKEVVCECTQRLDSSLQRWILVCLLTLLLRARRTLGVLVGIGGEEQNHHLFH